MDPNVDNRHWVKLRRFNAWGIVYLAPPDSGTINGMADSRLAYEWNEGEVVAVRFPDGYTSLVRVRHRKYKDEVHDHGITHEVSFRIPGFDLDFHGYHHWIALDEVETLMRGEDLPKIDEILRP